MPKLQKVSSKTKKSLPPVPVTFLSCDHTPLASIKECANAIKAQTDRLDILMCNAGVMALPVGTTKDGYEIQFGINHLSHALLVEQYSPRFLQQQKCQTQTFALST